MVSLLEQPMTTGTVSLADAKARLSELVEHAQSGETVVITRRGRAVARLTTASPERKPVELETLKALTRQMPRQEQSAGKFMRAVREDARY
jgi:prevent-host-death family protein